MGKKKAAAKKDEQPPAATDAPKPKQTPAGGAAPAARQPRRKKKGCCPDWLPWVVGSLIIMGVLPVFLLTLPLIVPPVEEASGGFTMVGGGGVHGVRGLWSVLNKFGTKFCAEHSAKDTIKCHFSVMQMSVAMLRTPGMVDFYTAIPQEGLTTAHAKSYSDAVCPLYMDEEWEEFVVDPLGVNPSQVANVVLNLRGSTKKRFPPISTRGSPFADSGPSLAESVSFIKCQSEFKKVLGSDRVPLMASETVLSSLWGGKSGKTIYAFGLDSALTVVNTIPSDLSERVPINVVILPTVDGGHQWYTNTRGREPCEPETFRRAYDSAFHYFAWVIRRSKEKLQQLPK